MNADLSPMNYIKIVDRKMQYQKLLRPLINHQLQLDYL